MTYVVHMEREPGRPLAVIRRRAIASELASVVPATCGLVWSTLREHRVVAAGRLVAVYLDDTINLEVGVELDAPFDGTGEVVRSVLPAGRVATTTHLGPYDQLRQAHDAIAKWCQSNGHERAGPCWEIYGHWREAWTRDPSQIRTDVCHLLSPAH